jgi:hypothetical protein
VKRPVRKRLGAADRLLARVGEVPAAAEATSVAIAELVERGLVERGPDGRLRRTEAGVARSRRLRMPEHAHLAQHAELERRTVEQDGARIPVLVDASESPLGWLARRRGKDGKPLLGAAAVQAGERFRAHLTLARTMPRVTQNWSTPIAFDKRSGAAGGVELSEAAASARQRVDRALQAVGPELGGILVDVCGFLKGLEDIERERRWPPRTAKVVLGLALDRLARHYGLSDAGGGGPGSQRLRAWRAQEANGP